MFTRLESSADGLSAEKAAERLQAVGPNRLPTAAKERVLKRFFKHFHDLLVYILLAAAIVTLGIGHGVDTGVILAVVLVKAVILEGLPAILTITLALAVQRMARRNAITRKLNAVETFGAVTVICSDKTGPRTRSEMTVRHVLTADGRAPRQDDHGRPRWHRQSDRPF